MQLYGQEKSLSKEKFEPHHSVGFVLSHAHVFEGRDALDNKTSLAMPALGIDFSYQFHPKWALSLQTDIIIEKFKVEKHLGSGGNKEVIERSYPIAPALMGIYKPNEHWNFMFGVGEEFAKEENLFLNRMGMEYTVEIRKGWEVFGTLTYDIKWKAYDTWVLGIGIAKSFGYKKKGK